MILIDLNVFMTLHRNEISLSALPGTGTLLWKNHALTECAKRKSDKAHVVIWGHWSGFGPNRSKGCQLSLDSWSLISSFYLGTSLSSLTGAGNIFPQLALWNGRMGCTSKKWTKNCHISESSSSQDPAEDVSHSLPLFERGEHNVLKHTVYTLLVWARTLQVALGPDLFGHSLTLLGADVSPKVWAGVRLGSHNDNGDTFSKKVFDFRGPEILHALEWVSIGHRETQEQDFAVLVTEGSQFCVLVLERQKMNKINNIATYTFF